LSDACLSADREIAIKFTALAGMITQKFYASFHARYFEAAKIRV
jgi:hypothetical protein